MTDFMTRVVLLDGSDDDYAALDAAMIGFNFATSILSRMGVQYRLPTGSYFSQSISMCAADVRNLVLVATRPIGKRVDIITMAGEASFFLHPSPTSRSTVL